MDPIKLMEQMYAMGITPEQYKLFINRQKEGKPPSKLQTLAVDSKKRDSFFFRAIQAYREGRYDTAVKLLEEVLAIDPNDNQAMTYLNQIEGKMINNGIPRSQSNKKINHLRFIFSIKIKSFNDF